MGTFRVPFLSVGRWDLLFQEPARQAHRDDADLVKSKQDAKQPRTCRAELIENNTTRGRISKSAREIMAKYLLLN